MVIAAMICFMALLLAWILAPDEARTDAAVRAFEAEALATA